VTLGACPPSVFAQRHQAAAGVFRCCTPAATPLGPLLITPRWPRSWRWPPTPPGMCRNNRRAPEYRFPAAIDDAIDAYRGLLDSGLPSDKIVVAGDSTGGGMAIVVANRQPLWVCPDPPASTPSARGPTSPRPTSPTTRADPMTRCCPVPPCRAGPTCISTAPTPKPAGIPVFGDFSDFPPLLIHVGTDEVLLGDAIALARQASLAGSDVTLRVWARMIHIFPWFHSQLQAGRTAITQAGAWIADVTAPSLTPQPQDRPR